ncbi:glycosyltransferase [candidate division KSB3 bacterium]|uniref:Glycosyltransferase n=1 Tax=candidate division KSB3 bacterium TaxID=2044937 RepID=A0A9D5Q4X5_9BACT|nr:glycosyltransferase [candidate division KSB3 bacterium]MBD3324000.1 glycosyltransferase [candidate division KSB3 bacterium]
MSRSTRNLRLVLFFTRDVSLHTWEQSGIFDREVALYTRLQQHGVHVTFVTYGTARDRQYRQRLPGIKILCNRWNLPPFQYEYWLPVLHAFWLWRSHVLKTNQLSGADVALRMGRLWQKPVIARCGYMWSEFLAKEHGADSPLAMQARRMEHDVFTSARRIVVTTSMMAQDIARRIPQAAARTVVIPNYVETDRFTPSTSSAPEFDLVFVGRCVAQKNIGSLLEAVEALNVRLLLIGDGYLRASLQQRFAHLRERVEWAGKVAHAELPTALLRANIFILPSHYEGHPKALLEAMSCGLPVIGTDVTGIRELIRHGEQGWLCRPDAQSIRAAIQHLVSQPLLRTRLGQHARKYVLEHFSLDKIVESEIALLREAVI